MHFLIKINLCQFFTKYNTAILGKYLFNIFFGNRFFSDEK